MIIVDKLCYYSKLRYINPEVKFAFAIITLLFCTYSRSIVVAVFVLLVNGILTVKKGGIPFAYYRKLMLIPIAFLLLGTLTIMVNISRTPLNAFAFSVGSYYITASYAGLLHGGQLILTALASVSCLFFLSLNTTITDILAVMKKLHVPPLLLELMLLTYRYIFVLLHMASSITTSQHSRLGNRDIKTSRSSFSSMISVLFIHSLKRANLLYYSMEARCYDGTIRVLSERKLPRKKEGKKGWIFIAIFELTLLLLTVTMPF